MALTDKWFPVKRHATVGGILLIDPATGKPYKAGVTVQQVEGGFDPTGLSTEAKQDQIVSALGDLSVAIESSGPQEVTLVDGSLPAVSGQATAAKQEAIISSLGTLAALLGAPLEITTSNSLPVSASSLPLPAGASTSAKQDAILSALSALQATLVNETLSVSGDVTVSDPVDVTGTVALSNASVAVTPSGTFNVSVTGGATSAKQDSILTALGNLLTAIQAPQAITDNGSSITVDGVVGISGSVPVTDNGESLTVDGTVAATQSGTWNVGITGTPTVNIGNTVTISDGSGPVTVDGTVGISGTVPVSLSSVPTHAVTQSGTWTVQTNPSASATSGALTTYRANSINSTPAAVKTSSGRVYQYTIMNSNNTAAFVHLWDAAPGSITLGTTVPKVTLPIPAGSTLDGYWAMSHGYTTAISVSGSANWDGTGAITTGLQMTLGYA